MNDYIVSARKYRPMTFDDVVGQTSLTATLKNSVISGKLAHAYLFCGPRGVGKTTCARIFAKAINCESPTADGEACNSCESCKAFNEQRSFNIFELDAASNNKVEDIKQLMQQTQIPPQFGKYKVFIIDEVHMLTTAAFNAFLKTLEEPPAHVIFILATTEKHKILPTILSRCQIYDFERITVPVIIDYLKKVADKENITYDEQSLNIIAEKADGGMRDALSIFDQVTSFCRGNLTYEKVIEDLNVLDSEYYFKIIDYSLENKVSEIMVLLDDAIKRGFDAGLLVNGLASHVRNVLMAKDESTIPLLEIGEREREKFKAQASKCPVKFLYKALKIMNRCDVNYRQSGNKRLLVELTLIEVAQITMPDDEDGGGRKPGRRLKQIFKYLLNNSTAAVKPEKPAEHKKEEKQETVKTESVSERPQESHVIAEETPEAVKPAAPKRTIKLDNIGFSFNNLRKTEEKPKFVVEDKEKEVESAEASHFTDEKLQKEWQMMCNRMPKQMVGIARRMKNMRPVITDYPNIEVVVDNKILCDEMSEIKGRINATLKQVLRNGNINMTLRLAKEDEVEKVLTEKELYEEMLSENSAIKKLDKLFNLVLG